MVEKIKEEFKAGIINKPQFIDAMYGQHQLLFEYVSLLQKVDIASIEITGQQSSGRRIQLLAFTSTGR